MSCNCHDYQHKVLDTDSVLHMIESAVHIKEPFSLTRFSHSEITYINWKERPDKVKLLESQKIYNGVTHSYDYVKKSLLEAINHTTVAGLIPKTYAEITTHPNDQTNGKRWYKLSKEFLHRENIMPKFVCSAWVTHEMVYKQKFWDLLKQCSIALVGRRAYEAVPIFEAKGINVTAAVSLNGFEEIDKAERQLKALSWDIAIISAGVPSKILTTTLAQDTGRVAIDFGHGLDRIIDGDAFDFDLLVKDWQKKNTYYSSNNVEMSAEDKIKDTYKQKKKYRKRKVKGKKIKKSKIAGRKLRKKKRK